MDYPIPSWVYESVVYQIFPDRFAIGRGKSVHDKEKLYTTYGGTVSEWGIRPVRTGDSRQSKVFYGGDLWGIAEKIDYIQDLGANCLYLTPIFTSPSNHKYDAIDYFSVDPQFGGNRALIKLIKVLKNHSMHLILDGVFNHMSNLSPLFRKAQQGSEFREFFSFYETHHRGWWGVQSLPELNLEEVNVRKFISSVLTHYLKLGIDGWRLDCGQDLGPVNNAFVASVVKNFSVEKYVVSELWTYPSGWDMVDGTMNYHFRELVISYLKSETTHAGWLLEKMYKNTPKIFGCWNMLDSHDTERLATTLPDKDLRKLAIVLQFTYPGVPVIFYGTEIGLEGGPDPECRAPMIWDESKWDNELREFYKQLIKIRRGEIALKVGEFVLLNDHPIVFLRKSQNVQDTILVAVNPDDEKSLVIQIRDHRILDRTEFVDLFTNEVFKVTSGTIKISIPAKSFRIMKLRNETPKMYDQYKRIV
ncbi:cyclomaltodextrinase [Fervidobacterium thailandense]|uniref:Cyclomaltodextrinase n=1 Tax=Fervidobacterium thailandense TaxID=1008305 RepID=A0A1E3G2Q8_9BACT|nr:cyclomaltodextrinase [Fervidobacterium thailandense]ODN30452.1 cyclomaltodextrinase [Fervidobacterium thailandense]